ncbi:MAG TPA: hypothetical protein ENI70_00430 [Candidatus Peregrinibacteria bacterium]|nr:hypothetical protein [Candidatus Peregrinibacteria bacterium]
MMKVNNKYTNELNKESNKNSSPWGTPGRGVLNFKPVFTPIRPFMVYTVIEIFRALKAKGGK